MADAGLSRVTGAAHAPAVPRSTVRALNCPNCGGTVNLRVAGTTVSVICEHCGSTLDATTPELQVIARASQALKQPPIRLGTRGTLRGITWEAVGFVERTDNEVTWAEYLLFNPYEGYAFLVDDGQDFSFGRVIDRMPAREWDGEIEIDGMQIPASGDAYPVIVTFVVGEFYWRVAVGERVMATDYQRGSLSYSREENRNERTWTRLDTLRPGEVEAAFGGGPQPTGGGGAPPSPKDPNRWRKWMIEAWVIATIAFVPVFAIGQWLESTIQLGSIKTEVAPGSTRTIVKHGIRAPRRSNMITAYASAYDLEDGWITIAYALVDPKTQRRFNANALSEHYHGNDENGLWSEGERFTAAYLEKVPAGQYDLIVTLRAHQWPVAKPGTSKTSDLASGNSSNASEESSEGNSSAGASPAAAVPVEITLQTGPGNGEAIVGAVWLYLWPLILTFLHFRARKRYREYGV